METIKKNFLKSTIAMALFSSSVAFAGGNAISGQLMIVNNMGDVDSTSNSPGATQSSFQVTVSDTTGVCSTTKLNYNGYIVVQWYSTGAHSSSHCVGAPVSIKVTPILGTIGGISTAIYDSIAVSAPDTSPTAATLSAPTPGSVFCGASTCTTSYENMAVIITGDGNPSTAASATGSAWQSLAATKPIFDTGNGALKTTGVFGLLAVMDFKAEKLMRQYSYAPHKGGLVSDLNVGK
ncbi:hypothetical protein [Legionella drancourtii]|uniref:Uncharacterized protein n=1 Tax=Legionella drancourtii LLAP12 TaxID=658187 RepID=G9EKN0_9GAMM|nr:hypothetical protein [Legionella drancourtii]EHL32163.1 hypothetical protein LDG_5767 [Legionella drancourtii LLAP12]